MTGQVVIHPAHRPPDIGLDRPAVRPLFTKKSVCAYLSISPSTLDRLVEGGALAACRIGGQVRFRPEDVEAFIDASRR